MKHLKFLLLISVSNVIFGQKIPNDSIPFLRSHIKLETDCASSTVFPNKNRTYDEIVGNYAIKYHFKLSKGWRVDSCNGGYSKGRSNPYIGFFEQGCKFIKTSDGSNFVYFYYKRGKRYSGRIKEKFNLLGLPSDREIIFRARCRNGKLQGKGTLVMSQTKELVGECFFENGELVGISKSWDHKLHIETNATYVKGSQTPINFIEIKISPKKQ